MFTVHEKNQAPETGFNPEPVSSHKSEETALAAAKDVASSADKHSNIAFVQEEGTNRTWTVQHISGEVTVGYNEGVPYLVPAADAHYQIVYDARENVVTERREEAENGSVAIFLDEAPVATGDFDVTTEEISS